jgi:hypothetical protein
MRKIAMVSALVITLFSCSMQKSADGTGTSNFEVLKQEGYGGMEAASNQVIKSQSELNRLYKELSIEQVPQVDFKAKNVVALFMGQKSTGGFSIGIDRVTVKGETADVKIIQKFPGEKAMVTMALTTPYCIAVIPKTKNVTFSGNITE